MVRDGGARTWLLPNPPPELPCLLAQTLFQCLELVTKLGHLGAEDGDFRSKVIGCCQACHVTSPFVLFVIFVIFRTDILGSTVGAGGGHDEWAGPSFLLLARPAPDVAGQWFVDRRHEGELVLNLGQSVKFDHAVGPDPQLPDRLRATKEEDGEERALPPVQRPWDGRTNRMNRCGFSSLRVDITVCSS
jgi:hypothetical protein